jgi:hypothetical protein
MSLAALLKSRSVTPVTPANSTEVTAPGRAVAEGYPGYPSYPEKSKRETKTGDGPLKTCASSDSCYRYVDENRQRRTIEIDCSEVTQVTANDEPARHHTWLITTAEGERFSSMFCPPLSLAEIQARYPDALVERAPDPAPAPSLSPDALEIAYAYLRHIGEQDLEAGQEFIEAVARDPEQLRGLYADVVKMGLAAWPTAEADQATDIEDASIKAKAVCSRCRHWTPDRINPAGGLGRCTIAAPASKRVGSLWPGDGVIHCNRFEDSRS